MIFITPPPPPNPLPQGEGGLSLLDPFPQGGREFGHLLPLPLREGVGGWGLMKIAIYFSEKLILFLFRLHDKE
jgi:hypothetical protein